MTEAPNRAPALRRAPPPPAPRLRRDVAARHPLERWEPEPRNPPPLSVAEAEEALYAIDWSPLAHEPQQAKMEARPIARKLIEAVMGDAGSIDQADLIASELARWPAVCAREAAVELARRHRFELRLADVVAALESAQARVERLRSRAILAICWHEAARRPKLWDDGRLVFAFRVRSGDRAWAVCFEGGGER